MKRISLLIVLLLCLPACAKTLAKATVQDMDTVEQQYSASPNQVYYAVRWALSQQGYPVANEDLAGGIIDSVWVPTSADSHFVAPFDSPDYGTTGAYHQLVVRVLPDGSNTRVAVQSRVKSVVYNMQSSAHEERAVHREISHYLRSHDISVTNLGVQ